MMAKDHGELQFDFFLSTSKIFHTTVFRVLWEENGLVFRDDIFCVQYYNNMKNYVKLTKKEREIFPSEK